MITEYYKNRKFMTQIVTAKTELFDKEYFWMKDVDGSIYLLPVGEDGEPRFA